MLTRVDRVQVVTADAHTTAAAFTRLLGAPAVRQDRVRALAARRTVLALGMSEVELLEPDGAGPVADFLSVTKGGLFAAGFATADIRTLTAHLRARGIQVHEEAGQLFLLAEAVRLPGLHAVVSAAADRPPAGVVQHLYEVTVLASDSAALVRQTATAFGLEPSHFVPIASAEYGYTGTLTLFHPDHLDRLEIVTPNDPAKTMGRFFAKRGPSLYMCFAEAADLTAIRSALLEHAPHDWTGPRGSEAPDSLFIHPKALGGMMLGVSRTSFAWTWSGHPERVVAAARA